MGVLKSEAILRLPLRQAARRCLALGLDVVFPPICALCATELETESQVALCPDCRVGLQSPRPACPRCGVLLPPEAGSDVAPSPCFQCRDVRWKFSRVHRLGAYESELRGAVLRIKRPHERGLASALGDLFLETHSAGLREAGVDVVLPIPMHWTRRTWRGTNAPHTLAERIARGLRVPLATHLLIRARRTAPQAPLSPRRRQANVRGAFRVRAHRELPGARVLVVDDIMTTGATVNEAAKMLLQAGAAEVQVAVLARAEGLP